ncbi:MAG: DUF421 domain-containing protein [Bdellovibrio sp.]
MFTMSLPWWEFSLRGLIVYVFLLGALRLTGRRQIGQLSPFDFVMLFILSNAVQNSMNGGDNSVTGGIVLVVTLIAAHWLISYMSFKYKGFAHFVDGKPEVLIHNGKLIHVTMRKEKITQDELDSILRQNGVSKIEEVKVALVESNGQISVIKGV